MCWSFQGVMLVLTIVLYLVTAVESGAALWQAIVSGMSVCGPRQPSTPQPTTTTPTTTTTTTEPMTPLPSTTTSQPTTTPQPTPTATPQPAPSQPIPTPPLPTTTTVAERAPIVSLLLQIAIQWRLKGLGCFDCICPTEVFWQTFQ